VLVLVPLLVLVLVLVLVLESLPTSASQGRRGTKRGTGEEFLAGPSTGV
jgi:hypothetical protein